MTGRGAILYRLVGLGIGIALLIAWTALAARALAADLVVAAPATPKVKLEIYRSRSTVAPHPTQRTVERRTAAPAAMSAPQTPPRAAGAADVPGVALPRGCSVLWRDPLWPLDSGGVKGFVICLPTARAP